MCVSWAPQDPVHALLKSEMYVIPIDDCFGTALDFLRSLRSRAFASAAEHRSLEFQSSSNRNIPSYCSRIKRRCRRFVVICTVVWALFYSRKSVCYRYFRFDLLISKPAGTNFSFLFLYRPFRLFSGLVSDHKNG